MALALPGLASGLDSTMLVNSLMQIEAIPQSLIKSRVSETKVTVTALQSLNSQIASLATTAANAAKPDALQIFKATTSSDSVTVTADATAANGTLDIVVNQTAQRHVLVSDPVTEWGSADFTIKATDGTVTDISAASTSLDDVVSAVNASDAGVTATKVAMGNDAYRIQFTADQTGKVGFFELPDAGTATTVTTAARDAKVVLWADSLATSVSSSSNTFEDLLPGVDITVSKASTDSVTINVARDDKAAGNLASGLVNALTGVLSYIKNNSAVTRGTGGTSGQVFTGDSTARDASRRLLEASTAPVDGRSPSEIGIVITKDGTVEYDAEKFKEALAADPARVEATLQQIASRIESVATGLSDKHYGQITTRIQGQEGLMERMNNQVLEWDRRLETRRATLERTYASLEVQMSALNSQMSYLTSQLSSLPSNNTKK